MNGWTEITGENQRFELYRVVVEKKEKKTQSETVLFSQFGSLQFKFLSRKAQF